jgi:hypothetical protein
MNYSMADIYTAPNELTTQENTVPLTDDEDSYMGANTKTSTTGSTVVSTSSDLWKGVGILLVILIFLHLI